jgi:hypothetical protein
MAGRLIMVAIQVESPFDQLDYDVPRVSPSELLDRLQRVGNAMVLENQNLNNNRGAMNGMGRKDPGYDTLNLARYEANFRMNALKVKFEVLQQMLFMKSAEMRMVAKDRY